MSQERYYNTVYIVQYSNYSIPYSPLRRREERIKIIVSLDHYGELKLAVY